MRNLAKGSAVGAAALLIGVGALVWQSPLSSATPTRSGVGNSAPSDPNSGYSVFDRPATQQDEEVSGWAAQPRRFSVRIQDARVVYQDATRIVAAVPGEFGPCLVDASTNGVRGGACATKEDEHPMLLGYSGGIGLIPDGVKAVVFTMTDGTTDTQDVSGNLWRSPAEASRLSYVLDGREFDVALMPHSSIPEGVVIDERTGTARPKWATD